MKKLKKIFLSLVLVSFFSVNLISASAQEETTPGDVIESETQVLVDLQKKQNTLKERVAELEKKQKDKKTPLSDEEKEELKTKKSDIDFFETTIAVKKIEIKYDNLLKANDKKNKEIQDEIKICEEICPEKDILLLRKKANEIYDSYLVAKGDIEKCKADEACDGIELQTSPEEYAEIEKDLTDVLREITTIEIDLNRRATFDVSDIFSTNYVPGKNNESQKDVQTVVNTIANWMITLVASLAVTTLIIGGGLMIISGGDESRLETGKTIFTYSLIGIIVTLMAFGIISFIQSIFYS